MFFAIYSYITIKKNYVNAKENIPKNISRYIFKENI